MSSFKLFCLLAILLVSVSEISGQELSLHIHACSTMDTNPSSAREHCTASCVRQNCSNGHCEKIGKTRSCSCSGCRSRGRKNRHIHRHSLKSKKLDSF